MSFLPSFLHQGPIDFPFKISIVVPLWRENVGEIFEYQSTADIPP